MGRKIIEIKQIPDDRKRRVTFGKRRSGLFKKVMELSILCNCKGLLVLFDENDSLYEYCTDNDPKQILRKYLGCAHLPHHKLSNGDYGTVFGDDKSKDSMNDKDKLKKPSVHDRKGSIEPRRTTIQDTDTALFNSVNFPHNVKMFPNPLPDGYRSSTGFPNDLSQSEDGKKGPMRMPPPQLPSGNMDLSSFPQPPSIPKPVPGQQRIRKPITPSKPSLSIDPPAVHEEIGSPIPNSQTHHTGFTPLPQENVSFQDRMHVSPPGLSMLEKKEKIKKLEKPKQLRIEVDENKIPLDGVPGQYPGDKNTPNVFSPLI